MNAQLDEAYFTWLYAHIDVGEDRWKLARQLYKKEFVWLIQNDDNRALDGLVLRYEFVDLYPLLPIDLEWLDMGCSMLEMLVALSDRAAFLGEGTPQQWFWEMMENLAIYSDEPSEELIEEALDKVIWRTYNYDGEGGLFPLENPVKDQRKVEIWYQLNSYLIAKL